MRRIAAVLIGALCFVRGAAAQAPAQQAPPRPAQPKSSLPKSANAVPDLAFLEYLGSWQGDDDEWLAVKEWDQDGTPKGKPGDAAAKPPDPAAKPKEPAPQGAGNDHDQAQ
ncbi:MAG TPA: hypothetical protein VMV37_10225 [Gammaproteobacteria bacterium]|nr:hypothetical protein [Gammaproteobacteria bacterium]